MSSEAHESELQRTFLPGTVIEEETVPINDLMEENSQAEPAHVIEFETALMALEPFKKIQQPCPKKTMQFGVALTKKNFDYLRPQQIKDIKEKQKLRD